MRRLLNQVLRVGVVLVVLSAGSGATSLEAQFRNRTREDDAEFDQYNIPYDGKFTFVRLRFEPIRGFYTGGGFFRGRGDLKWDHDYPRAEHHLMKIMDELTTLLPHMFESNILALDDPELFKYPVAYMSEPGFWTMTDKQAATLRDYLLKGGFLIFDDFAGGSQFANFMEKMRDVIPDFTPIQLTSDHPIFHSFFEIDSLNLRHPYYQVKAVFIGIFEDNDPDKRLMAIANYNNDIGESWEWSDEGFIPIDLTNQAYKLGVNYLIYALSH